MDSPVTETETVELTAGERKVYDGIVEGLSNKEIADNHGLAEKTIKAFCTHIFKKLRVESRSKLIVRHYRLELESLKLDHKAELVQQGFFGER